MRPMFTAALAAIACLLAFAAPARATIPMGIWGYSPGFMHGVDGRIELTNWPSTDPVRVVGLADIETLWLSAFFYEAVPGGFAKTAFLRFDLAEIETFSATVIPAWSGAYPTEFSMVTRVKAWTPGHIPLALPDVRIVMTAKRYELVAEDGRILAAGSLFISGPEPAAWAFMLAGFGIAGAALRRSRNQTRSRTALAGH